MNNGTTKFTVNSPEVAALLMNVGRCSPQSYYKVDCDGNYYIYPIRQQLVEQLRISPKVASQLLKDADIPLTEFIKNTKPPLPEPEADAEARVIAALEAEAREEARQDKLAKKAELEERANSRRYQLIETNSGKCGIWNAEEGRVICLYLTKEEADEEMARLRAGSSQAGFYHYGSRRQRLPGLIKVLHY